jgi:hypothetical protein
MFDYASRRRRLGERLEAEGIAALRLRLRRGHGASPEDIVVCEEGGGRKLNSYPAALVANN